MKLGFRFGLIIVVCLIGLSCTPKKEIPTLHVSMSLGEEEWQILRNEIFPLFEARNNVKIEAYQIDSAQLVTKLEALQAAGQSGIDVFAQDNMSLAALVNKNLVMDLSPYKSRISSQILANLVEAGKFSGTLYFMPFRPNVQIVYYNALAFQKYEVDVPKTWVELLAVAEYLYAKEDTGRVLLKGYGGNPTATQVYEFILQGGGDPYNLTEERSVNTFNFLKQLSSFLSPESKRAKWDSTNDILAKQEAYLAMNWPFGAVILTKDYGLDFIKTYSGWSGPAGEHHVIGGDVFGIPKQSQNVALALDFIQFMQSKEIQQILITRLGWPSIRSDAYGSVADWQKPYFASVLAALQNGSFRKNVAWWPAYAKYVSLAFQEIVFENKDVRKTLAHYQELLEQDKTNY